MTNTNSPVGKEPGITEPVCGSCENYRSDHYCEDGVYYCSERTTGDVFTDEPSSDTLLNWMEKQWPQILEIINEDWKSAHGHD